MIANAWLSLGANIGDPVAQLEAAIFQLNTAAGIEVIERSAIITTKAWGKTDQPDFLNMALGINTHHKPLELLDICLGIEQEMGRVRHEVWGPRLIDIDIIAFGYLRLNSARLTLPHPFAHQREFVLTPLREIAPEIADWVAVTAPPVS